MPFDFVCMGVSTAARLGLDVDRWLRSAGISPMLLDDRRSRITVEQSARLMRELWRITDDELFGLGPHPVPRGSFRLVAFALVHSADLRTAIERLADFSRALPGLPHISAAFGERSSRIELDTSRLDDPDHLLTGIMPAFVHRFLAWSIARRIRLLHVELPFPATTGTSSYDLVFGAPLRFSAGSVALVFDSTVLAAPLMRDEAALTAFIDNAPADLLSRSDYGASLPDRVRRLLERGLKGADWPTPEQIAARLAMSPQTLRRKLRAENTSVTTIKEELLRDAAIAQLVHGTESVAELSEWLGFSEPSAFRRAFRRWTGSPPGAYRGHSADHAGETTGEGRWSPEPSPRRG
jgi:AraC-like DNA-binding protein